MDDPLERLRRELAENHRSTEELAEGLQGHRRELRGNTKAVAELRGMIERLGVELVGRTESVTEGLRVELRAHTESVAEGLRVELRADIAESRRHFEVITEGLRSDLQLVAEAVVLLNEKVDRGFEALRREMAEGFAGLRSLFKIAFADHERRIQVLEQR